MKKSKWIKNTLALNLIALVVLGCGQSEKPVDKPVENSNQQHGEVTMTNPKNKALVEEITDLEDTMHEADQYKTLEEKIADMKRRGIDPNETYADWGDEEDEWDNADK